MWGRKNGVGRLLLSNLDRLEAWICDASVIESSSTKEQRKERNARRYEPIGTLYLWNYAVEGSTCIESPNSKSPLSRLGQGRMQ